MLTREHAQEADDIKREKVPVPEWAPTNWTPEQIAKDAFYWVTGLSGDERDAYEQSCVEIKKRGGKVTMKSMRARLVVRGTIRGENDSARMFSDADLSWIGKKSAKPLDRLYEVITRLSGVTAEDMEELEKNLESIPSGDSSAE